MTARIDGMNEAALAGQRAAQAVLVEIDAGTALPDALLHLVLDLQADDRGGAYVPPTPRVRAFLRAVQRRLEASR
jgi:hypothetical protein